MKQCKECQQPLMTGGYRDSALEAGTMKAVMKQMSSAARYQTFIKRHKKKILFPFVFGLTSALIGIAILVLFPGLHYLGYFVLTNIFGVSEEHASVNSSPLSWFTGICVVGLCYLISKLTSYLLDLIKIK